MTALTWQELCDSVPRSMHDADDYLAGLATLSEDERAALWLYAWCRRDGIGDSAELTQLACSPTVRATT